MSWGEVKKAINSTLGTEDFKSLDEIILGEKTFVGSDTTLIVLGLAGGDYYYGECVPQFKLNVGGVIRINANVSNSQSTYGVNGGIRLTDVDTGTVQIVDIYIPKGGNQDIMAEFNVDANKTYEVYFDGSDGLDSASLNSIKVCGQVIDSNYFSIVV